MNTEVVNELTEENLKRAAQIIKNGGLVAFPTETVYGLGASALDPNAAKKIYAAKGRPSDNPLIIHLCRSEDASKYCVVNETYIKLAEKFTPGPLTIILPKKENIPYEVTGGLETVAVRTPSSPVARKLIELAGVPIAAPSANLSGKPSPTKADHVIYDMFGRIDMILCGEDCDIGVESTIITLATQKPMLLRPGKVTVEELKEICPDLEVADAVTHKFTGKPQSPGMRYKHYAPRASITLLSGNHEKIMDFLRDKTDCGIMYYDEDTDLEDMPYALSIGSKDNYDEQAKLLFARLREFDENENIKEIYAPLPKSDGVGLAVLNRLIRAAGFNTMNIE